MVGQRRRRRCGPFEVENGNLKRPYSPVSSSFRRILPLLEVSVGTIAAERPNTLRRCAALAELTTLRLGGPAARLRRGRRRGARSSPPCARPTPPASRCSCSPAAPTSSSPTRASRARSCGSPSRGVRARAARLRGRRRRAVGPARRALRRGRAWPASSASPGSPARSARRRSRTSAPTARRSRRRSSPCARTTARSRPCSRSAPDGVRLLLPLERLQAHAGPLGRARGRVRARAPAGLRSRSATPSWRARSGSPRASARRWPTCATAVLALRRGKGMVIDPADPDSVSAGSFFTNPVLGAAAFAELEERAREWLGDDVRVPRFPQPDGSVKTLRGVADRARRLRARARRPGDGRDLRQAHARADQPRRGHDRAARRAGARDRRGRRRTRSASSSSPSRCSSGTTGAGTLSRAGSGPRTRRARPAAPRRARRRASPRRLRGSTRTVAGARVAHHVGGGQLAAALDRARAGASSAARRPSPRRPGTRARAAPPPRPRRRPGAAPAPARPASVVALPSPDAPQAEIPLLSTSSGRTPANCGHHSTASASLPTSSEPTCRGEPVRDRRVDRDLGEVAQHARVVARAVLARRAPPSSRRRSAARAGRPRRSGPSPASPTRASRSRRGRAARPRRPSSAAARGGAARSSRPRGRPGASTCTAATIARCSASAPAPNGTVGEVEEVSTRSRPASASRSGAWPPPQPSMWNAWIVRPPNAASVSSTDSASLRPSVWIASWTSWRSARSSAQRICSGPAPTSSWIFSPPPPARSASSTRLGPRGRRAHEQRGVDGVRLERGPGRGEPLGRVRAEVPDRAVVLDHERRQAAGERGVGDLRREPVHVRVDAARA